MTDGVFLCVTFRYKKLIDFYTVNAISCLMMESKVIVTLKVSLEIILSNKFNKKLIFTISATSGKPSVVLILPTSCAQ